MTAHTHGGEELESDKRQLLDKIRALSYGRLNSSCSFLNGMFKVRRSAVLTPGSIICTFHPF